MATVLLAVGLVLAVEGLVIALAPLRIEDILAFLARLTRDQRRMTGLAALGAGVALIALSRVLAGA